MSVCNDLLQDADGNFLGCLRSHILLEVPGEQNGHGWIRELPQLRTISCKTGAGRIIRCLSAGLHVINHDQVPIYGGCDWSQRSTTVTPSKKNQGRRRWIDQPSDRGFLGQERKPLGAQAPGHRFSLRMPDRGLGEQVSAT